VDIDLALVVALAGIMFVASVLNGIAGFGFALVAVAGMAVLLEPKPAVVLMSLVTPVLTTTQMQYHWAFRRVTRRLPAVLLGAAVGAVVGTQLLIVLPGYVLAIALGAFALWFAARSLRSEPRPMASTVERRIAPGVGLVAGITNGSLGASGPILGSYLIAIGLRGREFVFAISAIFGVMAIVRVTTLGIAGEYTLAIVALGLGLTLPAYLGQRMGFWLQGRLSPVGFQYAILIMLFAVSVALLYRGVSDAVQALAG